MESTCLKVKIKIKRIVYEKRLFALDTYIFSAMSDKGTSHGQIFYFIFHKDKLNEK